MRSDALRAPFPVNPRLLDGIEGGSEEARRDLAAGRAYLVVTGQQPCFPLPLGLTLLKIATAVELAAALAGKLGAPVYPLFWNGADDSDFEEARGLKLARAGAPPLSVAMRASHARKGGFVGDLRHGIAFAECRSLAAGDGLGRFEPLGDEDLGEHQGRILRDLFLAAGLMTIDARSEALRGAAGALFMSYAERRSEFAAMLDRRGDELESELGTRPLRRGLGERALFFLRRRRRVLPPAEDYGRELVARLRERPDELSPNAALRPLIQDGVLPVAAVVLGPSEWNYHLQLRELFALLEVPFPEAVPRLSAAWAGDPARGLDDEGRYSSPLTWPDHPLADPELLASLARRHLETWSRGKWMQFQLPGDERGN